MESLWPLVSDSGEPGPAQSRTVTDRDLEHIYAYPEPLDRAWVQVNFVSSIDGAVSVAERSAGLSHPADRRILSLGRDLADVVLVGAGTAKAEGYRGIRRRELRLERRTRLGLPDVPPIAVVSGRCSLSPDDPLISDTIAPPIVITTDSAPTTSREDLVAAGVDVIVAGTHSVDLPTALDALAERGLRRVNCEGGPRLFASLVADDLIDQLCLTVAPLMTGAGPDRLAVGRASPVPRHLRLVSALEEDGFLMLRYRRDDTG